MLALRGQVPHPYSRAVGKCYGRARKKMADHQRNRRPPARAPQSAHNRRDMPHGDKERRAFRGVNGVERRRDASRQKPGLPLPGVDWRAPDRAGRGAPHELQALAKYVGGDATPHCSRSIKRLKNLLSKETSEVARIEREHIYLTSRIDRVKVIGTLCREQNGWSGGLVRTQAVSVDMQQRCGCPSLARL